jgi:hypothetical protein
MSTTQNLSQQAKTVQVGGHMKKVYYRIDQLFAEEPEYETKFITSYEYKDCGSRVYFLFETYLEFIKTFIESEKLEGKHYFHEFISGSSPFRMFFDIDCNEPNVIDKEDLLSDFVENCLSVLSEKYFINYPLNRISVLSCHKEDKHSFHVIFPDICVPDMFTMKIVAKEIKLKMEYGQYLDISYQNNKNFRLPLNYKFGKSHRFEFQPEWNYIDENTEKIQFAFEGVETKLFKCLRSVS